MGGAGLQEQETLSLGMRRFEGSKGRLLGSCFNLHRHVGSHFLRVCKLVRNTSPAEGHGRADTEEEVHVYTTGPGHSVAWLGAFGICPRKPGPRAGVVSCPPHSLVEPGVLDGPRGDTTAESPGLRLSEKALAEWRESPDRAFGEVQLVKSLGPKAWSSPVSGPESSHV